MNKRKYQAQKYVRSKSSGENILGVTVPESYILNDLGRMCAAQNRVKYMSSSKWNHYRETLHIQWHRNILVANSTPLFIAPEVRRSPSQSKCASSLLSAARTSHFPYGCGNGIHNDIPIACTQLFSDLLRGALAALMRVAEMHSARHLLRKEKWAVPGLYHLTLPTYPCPRICSRGA